MEEEQKLKERLYTAEATLAAILKGDVDAIVVKGPKGDQLYSLISPDQPYKIFIENMEEAALILSQDGTILYCNRSFFNMVGSTLDSLSGTSIFEFIHQNDRSYFQDSLNSLNKNRSELHLITKNQDTCTVLLSVSKGIWENTEHSCVLLTDISKLKRAQLFVEASELIVKMLSTTTSLCSAAQSMIELLKTYFNWDVIIIWAWDQKKQKLHCMEIAHVPGIDIKAFAEKTREIEGGKSLLSSHVWSSFRAIWKEDVTEDANFLRRNVARQIGLHGALAFPFFHETHLGGVVELFRLAPFREGVDESLSSFLSSVGLEVGLFIQRLTNGESKVKLATVLEHSHNGIYSIDQNGNIISWNPTSEKIFGWTAKEMIGSNIKKTYPPELHEFIESTWSSLYSGSAVEHFQSERLRKDGKVIIVNSNYSFLYDLFGKISGIYVFEEDLTKQHLLAENLAISEEKFRSFIDITEDWIWEIDTEGTFLFSNDAVFSILGYNAENTIGKSIFYFVPFEDRGKIESIFKANVKQKKGWVHLNVPLIHKDGTARWVECNSSELLDANHKLIGFRGASRDITQFIYLEKVKNEFISIVNHEIRTPLTSIYGALTLLTSKEMPPAEQKELITIAQRNSIRLTKIINDIMDVEKIKLGKLTFDFKKIKLSDVILESINTSKIAAEKMDIKIIANQILPDLEVYGDYSRLLQVMLNLLSNAIKFSPSHGTIEVSMEELDSFAKVLVKDYGQGIPANFQSKIFEGFAQADSSSKRSSEGTGLGLSISKSIVEGHGGEIHYQSDEGRGTTFFFDIPLFKE